MKESYNSVFFFPCAVTTLEVWDSAAETALAADEGRWFCALASAGPPLALAGGRTSQAHLCWSLVCAQFPKAGAEVIFTDCQTKCTLGPVQLLKRSNWFENDRLSPRPSFVWSRAVGMTSMEKNCHLIYFCNGILGKVEKEQKSQSKVPLKSCYTQTDTVLIM